MQPIVNGLEEEFAGQLAFERIDANTKEGAARMKVYGLRGHPSYAIVDPEGNLLWFLSGQTDAERLRQTIRRWLE